MIDDARFAELADAVPFPMWRTDARGRCNHVNRAWSELTGIPEKEALGTGWLDCVHPEDLNALRQHLTGAKHGGLAYQAEYRLRDSEGRFRWIVDSATPRFGPQGVILGYVGTLVDIGGRKENEARLRQAERRLDIATKAAGIGVWEWDLATNTFFCSSRALEIFGLSTDTDGRVGFEVFRRVIHPDDLEGVQMLSARALDPRIRSTDSYRYRIVHKETGETRWVLAHGEAIFAGHQPTTYIGTFQDVTDEQLSADSLREYGAKLEMALRAAGLVLWELDLASEVVTPSPELNELFGLPRDGHPTLADLRALYAPGEHERLARLGAEATARGENSLRTEFRHIWPDGTEHWAMLLAQAAPPAHGSGPRAIGVLLDITAQKLREERISTVAHELQHRVKNSLSVIQSIAVQTFKGCEEAQNPLNIFVGRLHALAAAADALTHEQGTTGKVGDVVARAVGPYMSSADDNRFSVFGPDITIDAQSVTALAMALHELCTNAVKYGALSSEAGQVTISWAESGKLIELNWIEEGGPPVAIPPRDGFGSKLIRSLFPTGSVHRDFLADGVRCKIGWPRTD